MTGPEATSECCCPGSSVPENSVAPEVGLRASTQQAPDVAEKARVNVPPGTAYVAPRDVPDCGTTTGGDVVDVLFAVVVPPAFLPACAVVLLPLRP